MTYTLDVVPSVQTLEVKVVGEEWKVAFRKRLAPAGMVEYVCTESSAGPFSCFEVGAVYSTPVVISRVTGLTKYGAEGKTGLAEVIMLFDEDTKEYFSRVRQ